MICAGGAVVGSGGFQLISESADVDASAVAANPDFLFYCLKNRAGLTEKC